MNLNVKVLDFVKSVEALWLVALPTNSEAGAFQ